MIVTQINIDLAGEDRAEYVVSRQKDEGRVIQVTLYDNGNMYLLDNKTTARVYIVKPDKTEVIHDCKISNNRVEIELDANILAMSGIATAEIFLTGENQKPITSAKFDLIVKGTLPGDKAESSEDYQSFKAALGKIDGFEKEVASKATKQEVAELREEDKKKATKEELEVERSRINNLAKLEEGATTGDAELVDIRVGEDGETYDTAGAAVRGQNKKIKENISEIRDAMKADVADMSCFTLGKVNENTGVVETSKIEMVSDYALITERITMRVPDGYLARACMYSEFDGTKRYIGLSGSGAWYDTLDITPGENTNYYYRFSIKKNNGGEITTNELVGKVETTVKELQGIGEIKPIRKELKDIRTAADGTVYETAGEAVREQVKANKVEIDANLEEEGKAADAKAVGDVVGQLKEDTNKLIDNTKIAYGKNRCPTKFFDGYLNDKGVLISYSDWKTTDFIYVEDLENVIFSAEESGSRKKPSMFFLTTYDSSKNIISYVKTNPQTYAVEDNVCYIRFAFHSKLHKDLMVESGKTASDKFEEYTITYEFLNPSYATYDSIQKPIEVTNNIEYVFGKNRYNSNGDEDGYLLDTSKLEVYSDWRTTSFIDVRGLKEVTASCTYGAETTRKAHNMFFLCIYDENKKFIRQIGNVTRFPYAIPDNVAYLRYSYHASKDNNIMVESGSNISTYEPYEVQMRFIKSPYNNMLTWRNKKWLCLGDSLTEVNIRTTKHYHDYIAEATGISVLNFGSSGTGYKRTEDENKAFYQRIASMPTDVDVVTIFGSGNDLGGGYDLGNPTDIETDTICGCINKTIDTIIGIKPNVSLGIIAPTPWVSYPPNISNNAMANYVNALKTICENRSIPFLDLYHSSNLRPWTEEGRNACYTKDEGNGVHPDETGHKLIAPRFKAFLETLLM